jgi:RNA polymerase sigma-70 factor (ECF subfamily)
MDRSGPQERRVGGQGAPEAPPDAEVVRRVLAGEVALFELLVRRHNSRLHRAVRSVLRADAEVEDAMQQAYLRAFEALPRFAGESAFSTWLVRIGINEALGRIRRRERARTVEDREERMDEAAASPEDRAAVGEAVRLLERTVDRLPLAHRTVFVLRELEGLDTAETAEALGVSEDLVKVRLHRARVALRELAAAELGRGARDAFPFHAPRCDRVVAGVMTAITGLPRERGAPAAEPA